MIRLIASDLDGTLIPEGTQDMEPGFFEVLEELLDRGFLFYAASGRQYANMRRVFDRYADRMGFVCENGALAFEQEKQVFIQEIPRNIALAIAEDILQFPETEICLSGVKACYIRPQTKWFEEQMVHVLQNACVYFQDLSGIDDQIVKISMYVHDFKEHAEKLQHFFREKYGDFAEFVDGGNGWLDLIQHNSGKGKALEAILKQKELSPEEIMVFGDNQNDLSMLQLTPNSYAMAHAKEDVKIHAAHTCESVTKTLQDFLNCTLVNDVTPTFEKLKS